MKAKLEFNLELEEDLNSFRRAVSATDCYLAFNDILEMCRKEIKYGTDESRIYHFEYIRDSIYEIIDSKGINLDDLE